MKRNLIHNGLSLLITTAALFSAAAPAQAQDKKPNILFIMGDDIGMWNIGAYHRGMMAGRTPNLDNMAKEGMLFTDYYAEASCTAGRANFITGELPIRTGMTTVGQAGAPTGLPAEACTIATALKAQGYATGQFGKTSAGKDECSTALVRTDLRANGWRACLRVAVKGKSKTKQP